MLMSPSPFTSPLPPCESGTVGTTGAAVGAGMVDFALVVGATVVAGAVALVVGATVVAGAVALVVGATVVAGTVALVVGATVVAGTVVGAAVVGCVLPSYSQKPSATQPLVFL